LENSFCFFQCLQLLLLFLLGCSVHSCGKVKNCICCSTPVSITTFRWSERWQNHVMLLRLPSVVFHIFKSNSFFCYAYRIDRSIQASQCCHLLRKHEDKYCTSGTSVNELLLRTVSHFHDHASLTYAYAWRMVRDYRGSA
jgi:hypothetical protein